MLKVEPRSKLDRAVRRGPYRVQSTTQTNTIIRPVSDPTGEEVDVSLQRLSKCHNGLLDVTPWMGHGKVKRTSCGLPCVNVDVEASDSVKRTKCGRRIRHPARFQE